MITETEFMLLVYKIAKRNPGRLLGVDYLDIMEAVSELYHEREVLRRKIRKLEEEEGL